MESLHEGVPKVVVFSLYYCIVSAKQSHLGLTGKMFNRILKRGNPKALISGTNEAADFDNSPGYQTSKTLKIPSFNRHNVFISKLQICCILYDFSDTSSELVRERDTKRRTLRELINFIQSGAGKINEEGHEELIRMVSINIFRCLPPSTDKYTGFGFIEPEEEEDRPPSLSWPHMNLVYELLLKYVVSPDTDTKIAKRYIDHSFILKFIGLFDTDDMRERKYLKNILHRIYGKFMVYRPFIRNAINDIFYRFIFETERHCGISDLLEILGSIINGFALPMKEENKLFLVRVLIPLHKPKHVAMYHRQLKYCVTRFVERDNKLADTVIQGLLKYWPVSNSQKEILFLQELEEVLEAAKSVDFEPCMVPLFRQIARCLNSYHALVVQGALLFWKNSHILGLIDQNRNVMLPIIFEALEKNIENNSNQDVIGLKGMCVEIDAELFENCRRKYHEKEAHARDSEEERAATWRRLEAANEKSTDMAVVN